MKSEQRILRDKAYQFATSKHISSLATVDSKGKPHVAAVHFVIHISLDIYFSCSDGSRKFKNLTANPVVAMSITDEATMSTIQLTGKAEIIEDLEGEQSLMKELWELRFNDKVWPIPTIKLFESGDTDKLMFIKVTPTEMTYANFESTPSGKYNSFFQKII